MRTLILFALVVISFSLAWADTKDFAFATSLQSNYEQGAEDVITISVQLTNDALELSEAVVFLNIVEVDDAGRYPQAAHRIFSAAEEIPTIFKQVVTKEQLLEGLSTTLSFSLKDDAPEGTYSLVLQVLKGTITDPNAVKVEDRIALRGYNFDIMP